MSKIKVDEIISTDTNVKLSPKGTGLIKVKGVGGADGTLQLNSSNNTNSVKIKSPAHSSGQSYTMILPDNNIEADKFLKVKSITGSGATATGQLEYASMASADLSNLNADNLTSGTVPSARFPSTGFASKGAAFQLVQKQAVGSTDVASITFSNIENDTMYKMIGKHLVIRGENIYSNEVNMRMAWLDSNGAKQGYIHYERWYYQNSSSHDNGESYGGNNEDINLRYSATNTMTNSFVADIYNYPGNMWMTLRGFDPNYGSGSGAVNANKYEVYATFTDQYVADAINWRAHGIEINCTPFSNRGFTSGTEILLYKYVEI